MVGPKILTFPACLLHLAGFIFFLIGGGSVSCFGAAHFVAVDGKSRAEGTIEDPWDIRTAFAHPSKLTAGDTLYLRGGIYEAPDRLNLNSRIEGAPEQRIRVRPYGREQVVIDGGIYVFGAWVSFENLTVRNSNPLRVSKESGSNPSDVVRPTGFNVSAAGVRIVNCVIHDTSNGIGAWRDAPDTEVYGNVVFHNGWSGLERAHGHGMYLQNADGRKLVRENIVFANFEYGIQMYGSEETRLDNFVLSGNVVFDNGLPGGDFKRNLHLGGGVVAHNPVITDNYTYYALSGNHGGDNNIGYYPEGRGCSNLVLTGNYFVSGGLALTLHECTVRELTGNTVIGPTRGVTSASYPDNRWLSRTDRPSGSRVFVRPNEYEKGRAHIIVYNWDRLDSVRVDLTGSGLAPGSAFEIRDVQDLFGRPVAAGFYDGGEVDLPMNRATVTTLVGDVLRPATHTDREFGVYVVRQLDSKPDPEGSRVDFNYYEESEAAAFEAGAGVTPMPDASGGNAVQFSGSEPGHAVHWFHIPSAGEYFVWLRLKRPWTEPAVLSWAADDEQDQEARLPVGSADEQWRWVALNTQQDGNRIRLNPRPVYFTSGWHRILYRAAQRGLAADTLFVTNDFDFTRNSKVVTPTAETGDSAFN